MSTANARDKAVRQAIGILKSAGAQFAIVYSDQTFGELKVVAPSTQINWNAKYGHVKKVKAMQVGDVVSFDCDKEDVKPLASTIRGIMRGTFGPKSWVIDMADSSVSALRIDNEEAKEAGDQNVQ